jgi:uncharacterized protein YidB (DUF937 family)
MPRRQTGSNATLKGKHMSLLNILGGGSQGGGMSPLMLGLMGVLAYRTMNGKGRLADMLGMNAPASGTVAPGSPQSGGLGGLLSGGALGGILSGGLGDLLKNFAENGHGDKAQSWVSDGANKSISPPEMEQALGEDRVQWLMQQTGLSKDALMTGLSQKLPEVVDKLTPEGRVPTEGEAQRMVQ